MKCIVLHMRRQQNMLTPRNARMNKMQFMKTCYHVPITTTLQDLFKIDINNFNSNQFNLSQRRYDSIILDKEIIETFYLLKKH